MKKSKSDRLMFGGFMISAVFISVVYGIVSSWWGWFPAEQVSLAHRTLIDVKTNWKNDVGVEPTRHLVAPNDTGDFARDRGYQLAPGATQQPGFILVAGLSDDQETSVHAVRMFDAKGDEVHRWPIKYPEFHSETPPQNVVLHGMEVFEDGSVVVTFDNGRAIARVDACGETMWNVNGEYHHTITRDGAGGIWTWEAEDVVRLDENTGEKTFSLNTRREIIPANNGEQAAVFQMRTYEPQEPTGEMTYQGDPFHANDVEMLLPEMADAFPMFEAGDLLLSMRELNLVSVMDPDTGILKWWQHGPWLKQHDPDFHADGTITILDNAMGTGRSLIRRLDPKDNSVTVEFEGNEEVPFYTWRRGKHQYLPNGNVLLTEAEHGRILVIDPDSDQIVWSRDMVWDEERNMIITEARYVPETFFDDGIPSCPVMADVQ